MSDIYRDIPEYVQIGPLRYLVVERDQEDECGSIHYKRGRIRISSDLSPDVRKVTLWHEVIHGILYGAGIPGDEHDERTVDAIAHGLVSALRDNPDMRECF